MTTIAFDGKQLAADTLATYSDVKSLATVSKIWYLRHAGERAIVAGSGNPTTIMALGLLFLQNIDAARSHHASIPHPRLAGEGALVVIDVDTKRVFHMGQDASCVEVTGSITALGSGREFALGAMYHGASAANAVQTAMRFDPWTGGCVEAVRLDADFESAHWLEVQ